MLIGCHGPAPHRARRPRHPLDLEQLLGELGR